MGKYCYVASAGRHARRWGVHGERRVAGHFVSPRAQLIEDYNRLLPDGWYGILGFNVPLDTGHFGDGGPEQ